MNSKLNFIITGATAAMFLFPLKSDAQKLEFSLKNPIPASVLQAPHKSTPALKDKLDKKVQAEHPLLFRHKLLRNMNANGMREAIGKKVHAPKMSLEPRVPMRAAKYTAGRELWGGLLNDNTWDSENPAYGLYSFQAGSNIGVSPLFLNENFIANGGGALVGERLDYVYYLSFWGMIFPYHYAVNADTGEQIGEETSLEDYSLIATETAVAADGTVYGEFYSSDGSAMELGIVDYENESRSTIGTLSNYYLAMGITSDGKLYGIADDGNLYQISTANAAETLVGPTGLTVSDDEGAYYQSGEIDQKTNEFYWATADITTNTPALYTVNLQTGAASLVGEFTNQNLVTLLTVPSAIAEGAPAPVEDLKANFQNGELSGHVTFKMPSKNAKGEALSGNISYSITSGSETLKSGSAAAGQAVDAAVSFDSDGLKPITVIASNSEGNGKGTKVTVYVGYDTPKSADNLKLDINDATGEVKVSWDAVSSGVNDGYLGDVKYNVVRYPGGTVVAEGISATSFSEVLPKGSLSAYAYGVTAVNGKNMSGAEAKTDYKTYGDAIVPPYSEDFDDESTFNLFTVIDNNADGKSWKQYTDGSGNGVARFYYSANNNGDDWLITPPLKVEKNKLYAVSFKARSYVSSYAERLEVKYGYDNSAAGMSKELLPSTDLTEEGFVEFKKEIKADQDGNLYIGFHAISDADKFYLEVDDISVEAGMATNAPDSVSDFAVKAADMGALSATVSFKAPTKDISGSALSGNMSFKVLRDGSVIKEISNAAPGSGQSFVDNSPVRGDNVYRVEVSNANGAGRSSESLKVYVGEDKPDTPESLSAADNTSSVKLSWVDAEKGQNGGYVNPSNISHNIYNFVENDYGYSSAELAGSADSNQSSYDLAYKTNEGEQKLVNFGVSAVNGDDESDIRTCSLVIGKPYATPFFESATNGNLDNGMWWISRTGSSTYAVAPGIASDNDGGCFIYQSKSADDLATIGSGKISLAGATNPMLIFSHKATSDGNGKVIVRIQKPDGSDDELNVIDVSKDADNWVRESIALKAEYASLPYIIVKFVSSAAANESIYLDEFYVRDIYENDLTLKDISVPDKVKKGENAKVSVTVANFGSKAASGYTVKLYAGDKLMDSKAESGSLAPFASKDYEFEYATSVMNEGSSIELKAEVENLNDLNPDDNAKSATMAFAVSNKPRPASVSASENADGAVKVNWSPVVASAQTVNDGFEEYDAWSQDSFGEWIGKADGDKGTTGGLFQNYQYPGQGESFSYILVDPTDNWITDAVLESNESLRPHGGSKYLAAFYSFDTASETFYSANDWLISPTLSGKAQTVKFFVSNNNTSDTSYPETFDVLYSNGGTDFADFHKIGATHTASSGAWEEVSVEIPEGATRFAIHRNTDSDNSFMFMIDDVTYEAGTGDVTGYNVYRDGVLLKSVSAETSEIVDETAEAHKTYVYAVTAVFADGESEATIATAITTDIQNVENAIKASSYTVYTVDGKLIGTDMKSLKDLKSGAYIINDQKVIIR